MLKKKILVSVLALVAVVLLFNLPKVVVKDEEKPDDLASVPSDTEATADRQPPQISAHDEEISPEWEEKLSHFRESYNTSINTEKNITFAARSGIEGTKARSSRGQDARFSSLKQGFDSPTGYFRTLNPLIIKGFFVSSDWFNV